jgi:AcrR family transcriptional regulator
VAKAGPRPAAGAAGSAVRRGRSADVRAALVTAAIGALRETGFAGASAREIAARAGCSQALVFYHFGSVNDLLLAALDEVSAARMAAYSDLLDQADSVTSLVDSAREIFRRALHRSPLSRLLPPAELAHVVMAGFLGLEMLASLDGDRAAAMAMFDRARSLARVLDVTGGHLLSARKGDDRR